MFHFPIAQISFQLESSVNVLCVGKEFGSELRKPAPAADAALMVVLALGLGVRLVSQFWSHSLHPILRSMAWHMSGTTRRKLAVSAEKMM